MLAGGRVGGDRTASSICDQDGKPAKTQLDMLHYDVITDTRYAARHCLVSHLQQIHLRRHCASWRTLFHFCVVSDVGFLFTTYADE